MNNKKNKILIATTISLLSLTSISLGLTLKDNDNHYEKVSATDFNYDGLTEITYANYEANLSVGDKVYFINKNGSGKSGVGIADSNSYPYKTANMENLRPFIVTNMEGNNIYFKYTENNKYINIATGDLNINQTSMTYLTLNESSYFVREISEKTCYFGIGASYVVLSNLYPSPASNRFTCYKINNSTNSEGDFADAMLNDLTCDDGVNAPSTTMWENLEDIFDKLSVADKSELKNMNGNEGGTDVEQAIAKYDYIIKKYYKTGNYADFIGRIDSKKVTPDSVNTIFSNINNNDNGSTEYIVIAITATLSLLSIASFFFLKKRRA